MLPNDTESLMHPDEQPTGNYITIYLAAQSIPLVAYILFNIFKLNFLSILLLTLAFSLISFWVIQNISGFQLVGLRWSTSFSNGFEFFSKPIPFVPKQMDSNIFWLGFFVFMVLWVITFIICLFITTPFISFICVFGFLSQLANLTMFMRSYQSAKRKSEHETLEILQDEEVNFELVHSDNEEENKSETNEEVHSKPEIQNTEIKDNQNENNENKEADFDLPTFE